MNRTDLAAPKRLRSTTVALGFGLACLAWTRRRRPDAALCLREPSQRRGRDRDRSRRGGGAHPFGTCTMTGTVKKVERSTTCKHRAEGGAGGAHAPSPTPRRRWALFHLPGRGQAEGVQVPGRAYLDAGRVVLSKYEQLATAP